MLASGSIPCIEGVSAETDLVIEENGALEPLGAPGCHALLNFGRYCLPATVHVFGRNNFNKYFFRYLCKINECNRPAVLLAIQK